MFKTPKVTTQSTLTPRGVQQFEATKPKGDLSGLKAPAKVIHLDEVVVNAGPSYKAVQHLNSIALTCSSGSCGQYIRRGIEAGFDKPKDHFINETPGSAKDFGPWLESKGYENIDTTNFLKGDVAIFNSNSSHPYGHIQMYNGEKWVSDFTQNTFWASTKYRNANDFRIFRWFNR